MKKLPWVLLALLGFAGWLIWRVPTFSSTPAPAADYAAAMQKFEALRDGEKKLPLSDAGASRLLTHGHPTERVYVLLHGITNCPEQFVPLAKILFDSGANVVIPRARYAGFADLLNEQQGNQSGQDLIDQAAMGLDIAAGLGRDIDVVALSGSAVAAAWMAQHRDGIDRVVILSPFFGLYGYPVWFVETLSAVLSRVPNRYMWWDETLKEKNPGPPYAYPRYGTVCMADTIQLSRAVQAGIGKGPLKADEMHVFTTAADIGVNNELTERMVAEWRNANPGRVTIYEFPKEQNIPHDPIDPHQPTANTALTYPKVLEALGVAPAP